MHQRPNPAIIASRMRGVTMPKNRWPLIGHVPLFAANKGNLNKNFEVMHQECGRTFYVILPSRKSMLVTADAELSKRILLSQGADSFRGHNSHWPQVFKELGYPTDISNTRGAKWHAYRQALAITTNRQHSLEFTPVVEEKAARLIKSITANLDKEAGCDKDGFYRIQKTTLLRRMFGMAALEASVHIFLGERAPFLPNVHDESYESDFILTKEEAMQVADAMEDMFNATERTDNNPLAELWPNAFKCYRDLKANWKISIELPSKMVQKSLDEYNRTQKWPDLVNGKSLFPVMLKQEGITQRECVFLGVEATIAAVDTTATSSEFSICHLAKHTDAQTHLRKEILAAEGKTYFKKAPSLVDGKETEQQDVLDHAAYDEDRSFLRACIRESMRLTPTVGLHARSLTRDIAYKCPETGNEMFIPAETQVIINYQRMARDSHFVQGSKPASEFDPTRFLRIHDKNGKQQVCPFSSKKGSHGDGEDEENDNNKQGNDRLHLGVNSHAAAIPFGVGARRCPGGGLAQIFVETFTAEILKHFEVRWTGPEIGFVHKGLSRMDCDANEFLWLKPIRK